MTDEVEEEVVIRIIFTMADVHAIAESRGIDLDVAEQRALEWGKHITSTMSGYCAEQLDSVIVHDQP